MVNLDPAYGGQAETVKQLILALSEEGHQNEVVTLDDSDFRFPGNFQVTIHKLPRSLGKYHLNLQLIPWLKKNAKKFDFEIYHGIWQYQGLATWLVSCQVHFPYFIYTHGALDPWFKTTYPNKHLKKMMYWPWAEFQALKLATAVLFTSEGEKERAAESFSPYQVNGVVVNAGINLPIGKPGTLKKAFYSAHPDLIDKKIFLFMGRVHPIKGCDDLIKDVSGFATQDPSLHLVFTGPDVIGWSSALKSLAKELGIEERIS